MICQSLKEHRGIVLILIGFLILGDLYSTVNPMFETPDEIQHYFQLKHIADGKGLPVVRPQPGWQLGNRARVFNPVARRGQVRRYRR